MLSNTISKKNGSDKTHPIHFYLKRGAVAYKVLVGKPDRKRPLETPKHRWENNITIDHKEMGWEGVDWIDLAED